MVVVALVVHTLNDKAEQTGKEVQQEEAQQEEE